jgi:hypothetical protein
MPDPTMTVTDRDLYDAYLPGYKAFQDEGDAEGIMYGARFPTRNLHSKVPLGCTLLFRLKRCHACDECHSSRVFTSLTG